MFTCMVHHSVQHSVSSAFQSISSRSQSCSCFCENLQCSTLMLASLRGATKNFNQAGKFSTVVSRLGNNKLCQLLHLNLLPTLVVNMFKIKKYHNTIVAKIAMLEICSFVDHKLAVFTYFKCNFSLCTSQRCDQQKLSNLACSVKLKDWMRKWDNTCVIVGQAV